jgi:recombination protein RecR
LREDALLCYTSHMPDFAAPVERLIDALKHLPGIGQKTAQRLAFHLLRASPEEALALSDAIRDAKEKIRECSTCHNITDSDPCLYCVGPTRNHKTICVVEEAHNILAIEKTRMYSGMYHVLGGALSPLQGRGPEQLKIKSHRRRRGDRRVPLKVAEAARRARFADWRRHSGRRGPGIRG